MIKMLVGNIKDLTIAQQQSVDNSLAHPIQPLPGLTIGQFSLGEVMKEIDEMHMYKASGMSKISSRIV